MAKAAPPLPASAVALQSIWSGFAVQDDGGYPMWMDADAFADFVEACPELLTEDFTFDDAMDLYDAAVAATPADGDSGGGGGGEPAEGLSLKAFLGVLSQMAEERYPDVDYGIAYAKLLAAHVFRVRAGAAAAPPAAAAAAGHNEPPPSAQQQQQQPQQQSHTHKQQLDDNDDDVPDSWEDDTRFLDAPAAPSAPAAAQFSSADTLPQPTVASSLWSTASFSVCAAATTTTTTTTSLGGDPAAPTSATGGAAASLSSSAMMVVHAVPTSAAAAAISALDAGAVGLGGSGAPGVGGGGASACATGKPAPLRPGSPLAGGLLRLSPARSLSGGSLAAGLRPQLSPATSNAATSAAAAAASPQLLSFGSGSAQLAVAAPPSPPQAHAAAAASHAPLPGWRQPGAQLALRAVFRAHARKARDAALSDAMRVWQRKCSLAREGEARAALAASHVSERATVAEATASAAAAAAALAQSHLANTLAAHPSGGGHFYHDASVGGDDGSMAAASLMTPIKGSAYSGAGDAAAHTGLLQVNTSLHQHHHHHLLPSAPPSAMLAGRSVLLSPSALGASRGPEETVGTQTATFGAADAGSGAGGVDAGTSTTPATGAAAATGAPPRRRRCGRVRSACGWAFSQLLRLALVWGLIAGSRYIVRHRPELLVAWVGGAARARDSILAAGKGGGSPLAPLLRALPRFGVDGGCVVVAGRTLRLCDPAVYKGHASPDALAEDVSFGDVLFDDVVEGGGSDEAESEGGAVADPLAPVQPSAAASTTNGSAAAPPAAAPAAGDHAAAAAPALLGLAVDASGDVYDLPPLPEPPFLPPLLAVDADGGGCTNPLGCGSDEVAF